MLPRVVSLLPSATEIVCALGAREALVGVSHECDFPGGIEALPHCSAVKRPLPKGAGAIDRAVKQILEDALSVYKVDADLLKALKPDIIVTQAQCEICAVSEDDLVAALADWTEGRPQILSLQPMTLADVLENIGSVGAALGLDAQSEALQRHLERSMTRFNSSLERSKPRSVALIDWVEPLMMGAEWMPELVTLAGGVPLLAEAGTHTQAIPFSALAEAAPEVIIVAPCGLSMDEAEADMPALAGQPGWADLPAVKAGEVYVADGNHYFNRPGPRLVESLEIVAEILNPAVVQFGHRGTAYRPWPAQS